MLAFGFINPRLSAPESPTRAQKLRPDHKYERGLIGIPGVNNVLTDLIMVSVSEPEP